MDELNKIKLKKLGALTTEVEEDTMVSGGVQEVEEVEESEETKRVRLQIEELERERDSGEKEMDKIMKEGGVAEMIKVMKERIINGYQNAKGLGYYSRPEFTFPKELSEHPPAPLRQFIPASQSLQKIPDEFLQPKNEAAMEVDEVNGKKVKVYSFDEYCREFLI